MPPHASWPCDAVTFAHEVPVLRPFLQSVCPVILFLSRSHATHKLKKMQKILDERVYHAYKPRRPNDECVRRRNLGS